MNYLIYPLKIMNITQTYKNDFSHSRHTIGTPKDYPIDDNYGAAGSNGYFYCPCDKMVVKKIYGVSLDELGVGVINIGSISFEYIACLFDKTRIDRPCAIVTDGDYSDQDPEKSQKAQDRLNKLKMLFSDNDQVKIFNCEKTFEVELGKILQGTDVLKRLLNQIYQRKSDQQKQFEDIQNDPEQYLKIAQNKRKGWMAILIANLLSPDLTMPPYIDEALCHVVANRTFSIWKKACLHIATKQNNQQLILKLNETFSINDDNFRLIHKEPSWPRLCQILLPF